MYVFMSHIIALKSIHYPYLLILCRAAFTGPRDKTGYLYQVPIYGYCNDIVGMNIDFFTKYQQHEIFRETLINIKDTG